MRSAHLGPWRHSRREPAERPTLEPAGPLRAGEVDRLGGQNVPLATDYGQVHGASPRFGMKAALVLKDDDHRKGLRRALLSAQTNGVRYVEPLSDFREHRFQGPNEGKVYDGEEKEHWEAIALFRSGTDRDAGTDPGPRADRIRHVARGLRARNEGGLGAALRNLPPIPGDAPHEIRAAYDVSSGGFPAPGDHQRVREIHAKLRPILGGELLPALTRVDRQRRSRRPRCAGFVPTASRRVCAMPPRVIILSGPGAARTIDPCKAGVVIGRHADADVTLQSGAVSRRHARLTWEQGQVFVEDLGSSNGTFVNDSRISGRTRLRPGDLLRIGASVLRLATPATAEPEREMTIQSLTAAATSNQELFKEHAATKLQAVLQLAHQLGHSLEVDAVLRRLLDQLLVLLPKADEALVLLGDAENPVVRASAHRSGPSPGRQSFSRSVLRKVFAETVGVLAEDTMHGQAALSNLTLNALGIRSLVCVPLQAHGGRVFGALQLDRLQAGQPFSSDDLYLLTAVALMVAPVLENAQLQEEVRVAERLQRELALAREIQLGFLPREAVHLAGGGVELFAELHTALEVSGDFYDYFSLDDRRVAFAVADVSGKGMSAALFMTMVRALARHLAQTATGPADLLDRLNEAIARDNPNFQFVTMAAGIYDAMTGRVTLAHGGHPPVLLRKRDGTTEELSHKGAPLLGMQPGLRRSEEAVIALGPGDAIFLYTDGVTESPGLHDVNEMFGGRRLTDTIRGLSSGASLEEWTTGIRGAVTAFSGAESTADDITLLVLRRPETTVGALPATA